MTMTHQKTSCLLTLTAAALSSLAGCRSPQSIYNANFYERAEARALAEKAEGTASERPSESSAAPGRIVLANSEQGEPNSEQAVKFSDANESVNEKDNGGGADGVARLLPPALAANRAAPAGSATRPHIAPVDELRPVTFSQAEPRMPVQDDGSPIHDPSASWVTGGDHDRYPDEYLFDGGDRDYPVHYDAYNRLGLDTEDTVAEFRDSDGQPQTQSTNRVAIYGPRFASVRSVTTPSGDVQIARLSGLQDRVVDSGIGTRVGPDDYTRNDKLRGIQTRSRAGGVETREWERGVFNTSRLVAHLKLLNLRQDLSYWTQGKLEQSDKARLAYGIDAALLWTRNENPVATAQIESAGQVEVKFRAAEMVGTEPEENEPGRLKVVKLADRKTAQPGDTITFVIRYDNYGERPLYDLRLVDSLTPRLEYIEDSATSDRAGEINVVDNEEGSVVLTFKLDDPLPGKTGGVVTFQCKVR
jgi:uncharacterized repeat protein (TIGR01451 family)